LEHGQELAHLVCASAGLLVVPSMFEPCGLAPLIGMRYGTVFDRGHSARPSAERNGYMFHQADNLAIESAPSRVLGQWFGCPAEFRQLAVNSMRAGYSWARPGRTT
jgi:starch synthase